MVGDGLAKILEGDIIMLYNIYNYEKIYLIRGA